MNGSLNRWNFIWGYYLKLLSMKHHNYIFILVQNKHMAINVKGEFMEINLRARESGKDYHELRGMRKI